MFSIEKVRFKSHCNYRTYQQRKKEYIDTQTYKHHKSERKKMGPFRLELGTFNQLNIPKPNYTYATGLYSKLSNQSPEIIKNL